MFKLDEASTGILDLCNNNNGNPLAPGLHDLQFMVTDRPFFTPPDFADPTQSSRHPQCGVPDLAGQAELRARTLDAEAAHLQLDQIA